MWEGDAAGSMRLNLFVPLATARHPGAGTRLQLRGALLFSPLTNLGSGLHAIFRDRYTKLERVPGQ
jgi:hypothetical protein